MELITKYWFMILWSGIWLALVAYLVNLDKEYPDTPTNPIAYYIVWWYIFFVCAWPDAVGKALQKIADKVSNFTISFKKDE